MRFALTIFILTLFPHVAFCQEASSPEIDAAVKRLGADAFEEREKASNFLWRQGASAKSALEKAKNSGDPEISMRARDILKKINTGIFPDTPKALVEKLKKYNSLDNCGKKALLSEMAEMGDEGWKSLHFLVESQIADEKADLRPFNKMKNKKVFLKRLIRKSGEWDGLLESFLKAGFLGNSDFDDYLAWIIRKDLLKERIAEFEKYVDKPKGRQYRKMLAFMYRAAGDLKKAQETAMKSEHKLLALRAAMELGDFKNSLRIYKSWRREKRDVETLGWLASLQRLTGKKREFEETIEELIQLADKKNNQYWYVAKILMINELFPKSIDYAIKHRSEKSGDVSAFKTRPGEYLEANERVCEKENKTPLSYIRFLFRHGEVEKARKLFKEISDNALKDASSKKIQNVVALAYSIKDNSFDALLKIALESKNLAPLILARKIYGSTADWWWNFYKLKYPKENKIECFKRLSESVNKNFDKQDFISHLDEAEKLWEQLPEKEQAKLYALSALLNRKIGRSEVVVAQKIKIFELNKSLKNMLAVGDLYAENDNWEKASEWYKKSSLDYPEKSLPLYLWGYALDKLEEKEKGKKKMILASLLPLGDAKERYALAKGLRQHDLLEEAYREFQLIRLTEYHYNSWYLLEAYKAISNIYQIKNRNLLQAGDYITVMLFGCLSSNMSFISHEPYLWLAGKKHTLRAGGFMTLKQFKKALDEYQNAINLAHEKVDAVIKVVEEFEKNGRKEEAKALYQTNKTLLLYDLKLLPKSSQLRNSLAWLMACTNHDLEEALTLAKEAVEDQPINATYLYTLAEIYFRMKNREKAVEWQKKAVEYTKNRKFMEKRLKRFLDDPFPEERK